MESTINFLPPWERVDAFPEKPAGSEFGYMRRGKFVACSMEELVNRCRGGAGPQIDLIWHPDSPRLIPVTDAPFLSGALKERIRREMKGELGMNLLKLAFFIVMAVFFSTEPQESLLYAILAVVTGAIPLFRSLVSFRRLGQIQWQVNYDAQAQRWHAWVRLRPITWMYILGSSLVIVWLFQCYRGERESIFAAGLFKQEVRAGEWWRLLTGVLVHGSLLHVCFNAMALLGLGRLTEVLASRYHLALVFICSALSGSLFSLFLLPDIPTVGASGGLMGLFGFLVVLGRRHKLQLPRGFSRSLMLNVALIAAMGAVLHSMVDNAAHFGGFVSGVVAGLILIRQNDPVMPLEAGKGLRAAGVLAMLVTLGGVVLTLIKIMGAGR